MKHKNIIIIVLLLITIALGLFSVLNKDNRELLKGCQNPDKSYDKECVTMSKESRWANVNNGMPVGWATWNEAFGDETVFAKGPIKNGPSKIISTSNLDLVKTLQVKDLSIKCVGDLEITTCVIGNNPEVLRYWNVINYFY